MQRPGECYLQARYNAQHQEVAIASSEVALRHLRDVITWLIDAGKPGSHVHLDRTSGPEGDLPSLIVGREKC